MSNSNVKIIPDEVPVHDNTMVSDFRKCARWYYIRHILGLRPKGDSAALAFGGALHDGLAVWYKTKDQDQALQTVLDRDYPDIPGDYRTRGFVLTTLQKYIEHYGDDPQWDIVLNETPFSLVTDDGFKWGGRLDLGVRWQGAIWIVDHKSTSMGGPSWWNQFHLAPQMAGYSFAGGQLHGKPIRGVIINRVVARKTSLEFERRPFRFDQWKLDEWKEARVRDYHEIHQARETSEYPPNHYSCVGKYGKCPAFDVCLSPPAGRKTIMEYDFMEDRWDWGEE